MKRTVCLIVFCFLAPLICIVAYTKQHDFPFLLEQNKADPYHREESSPHYDSAAEKDVTMNHLVGTEAEQSDKGNAAFEYQTDENGKTMAINEPQAEAIIDGKTTEGKSFLAAPPAKQTTKDSVHFILTGRRRPNPSVEIIMIVSLVPKNCAHLTIINPAKTVIFKKRPCPIGELLTRGADRNQFNRAVAELSGRQPQFYIDLNLDGFIKMIDLLHKEEKATDSRFDDGNFVGNPGENTLSLLCDFQALTTEKENCLVDYLLKASDIKATRLGLKLLWIGYHNLTTDLSLNDLIRLRKITEKISPLEVSLSVIDQQ